MAKKTFNQSINRSIDQSINQSIKQSSNKSINQSIDLRLSVLQYTDVESRSFGCVLPFVEKTDQFRSFLPGAISSTPNQHWHVVLFFLKKKTDMITTKSTEYIL